MTAGPWKDRDDFEAWWKLNVRALNRLAVSDPEEWERVTRKIELFLLSIRQPAKVTA
jgi:hypothetical protein